MTVDYKLISCDDHLDLNMLPEDLWTSRMPAHLKDRAPHVEEKDGRWFWVCDGQNWGGWSGRGKRFSGPKPIFTALDRGGIEDQTERRPGVPELRLADMDRDGVFTHVIFGPVTSIVLDDEGIASQVQVISSSEVLKKVARQLDLASRGEFNDGAKLGPVGRLLVLAGLRSDPGEIPAEERVLQAMRNRLDVYRVEKSRVIVVGFSSEDPKLAAAVPNAIAETYIAVQNDAKLGSGSDATNSVMSVADQL